MSSGLLQHGYGIAGAGDLLRIRKELDGLIGASGSSGSFSLPELIRTAGSGQVSGLAVAKDEDLAFYLAILAGEPEGAVFSDEDGELYGDKAVVRLTGRERFAIKELPPDIVNALVMGCRIFDKSHLKKNLAAEIPEIGRKADGIGVLTIMIRQNGEQKNGFRVSIRKDGHILGSDVTTGEGTVSFRLLFGEYDCIVQDRAGSVLSSRIRFDGSCAFQTVSI